MDNNDKILNSNESNENVENVKEKEAEVLENAAEIATEQTDSQCTNETYDAVPVQEDPELKNAKTLSTVGFALGIASIAMAVLGSFCCGFLIFPAPIVSIAGLIISIIGMKKLKEATAKTAEETDGDAVNDTTVSVNKANQNNFAILGIVFSAIGLAIFVIWVIICVVVLAIGAASSSIAYSSSLS